MFQEVIKIDETDYIEVSTRLIDKEDQVMLAFRTKGASGVTQISALLSPEDAEKVVKAITGALASRRDSATLAVQFGDKS